MTKRMENALNHIKTSVDVDPWAVEEVERVFKVVEELERKWGAEEVERKCHSCKHYTPGEYDGSCGSYICKDYSAWEGRE